MAKVIDLETGKKINDTVVKPRIRATVRQKRVARELIGNVGMSAKQALERAGYSEAIQNNPKAVLESKGFIALMDEIGLTDDYLGKKLHEDIEAKPKNRVAELTLAYKVKGRLAENSDKGSFTPATINIAIIQKPNNGSVEP